MLAEELAQLSPPACRLIEAAAVAGDPFEHGLAAAIAEMTAGDEPPALDELLGADLIRPTVLPRMFGFRHPLVRHAVYQAAGGGWRIGAHARAAAALRIQGASAFARAHHIERSARPGDQQAVATLIEAGTEIANRAPATAARWYEAALRLMPGSLETRPRRLEVLTALAPSLAAAGRLEESRATLETALDLVPRDLAALRVRLNANCAAVEQLLGRHTDAHNRLQRALSELPDPASMEAATLRIELGVAALHASDFGATRAYAQEALDVASALGARPLEASAAALLASAESQDSVADSSVPSISRAAALLDELTDQELAIRIDAAHHLGWAEVWRERLDDAIRHLERGIAIAHATGQDHLVVAMMIGQGVVLGHRGRLAEAGELAESAVEAARLTGVTEFLARALSLQCWVSIYRGDIQAALRSGEEGIAVAATSDERWVYGTVGSILAQARFEAGDAMGSIRELLETAGGPDLSLLGARFKCLGYEVLVRADKLLPAAPCATPTRRRESCDDLAGG